MHADLGRFVFIIPFQEIFVDLALNFIEGDDPLFRVGKFEQCNRVGSEDFEIFHTGRGEQRSVQIFRSSNT